MTQNKPSQIESTTVTALVTLTVTPRIDQSLEEANAEMFELFQEYITERENTFLTDYGTTSDELTKFRAGDLDEAPTWGGYEGPYVLASVVERAEVVKVDAAGRATSTE